jgi:MoaE-MoaD fusion protein
MHAHILYLAGSKIQAECDRETLVLPEGATVGQVVDEVRSRHPDLRPLLASVRWARNHAFVELDAIVHDGDELALLPPVSGGAPRSELTGEPLDPVRVFGRVQSSRIGATVLFIGTVRNHSEGKPVSSITYEAYGPMAERQLEEIADGLSQPEQEVAVAISHRHGRLEIGDLAVVIAAAAPHRDAAFDACRAAIERIKRDVPIWKRETTDNGETWVGWSGG